MIEASFRPMQKHDLGRVAELERICFRSPWSERALAGELKNHIAHYCVAECDGSVIGYAGMWVMFDEAHITNVAIDPDFRHNGIGRALMKQMMHTALLHGATRMTLEVRESNALAQSLYFSMGFENAGRRRRYYSDTGEDAFILWNNDLTAYAD
ncbi:MAG: ribosomal protein S18-alanine N-acetyltransferase [Clostridia bacterium]